MTYLHHSFLLIRWLLWQTPLIGRFFGLKRSMFHRKGQLVAPSFGRAPGKRNDKLIVLGLPKSGNVWLASLLSDIFQLPIVHPFNDIHRSGITNFHGPLSYKIAFRKDLTQGVYIIRDVRDIVVSHYFYAQTADYRKHADPSAFYESIESFYYEYFLSKIVPRYNWLYHPQGYIEHGIPLVKYESLWDDTLPELERLFRRLGIDVERRQIEIAVDKNQIDNLRNKGREMTYRKMPETHFRKGGYGNYKNVLPPRVIEDLNCRFKIYLLRWGYY